MDNFKNNNYHRTKLSRLINKNKGIIELITVIFLISNIVLNVGYGISEENHSCKKEKCKICVNIEAAINSLNRDIDINKFYIINIFFSMIIIFGIKVNSFELKEHKTLIFLKVRLDI